MLKKSQFLPLFCLYFSTWLGASANFRVFSRVLSDNNTVSTIVELHVCLIYYTGIPASLYSHSHTIVSTISHQPIATIWGSLRSFYHHVGGSASMIPRSGAAAADWWIWPIRSAFRSFDNGRNIRYLTHLLNCE